MRILFLIALMLVCFSAVAGIYKYVDADGNVHYSDQEQAGAEEVDLPAAVTYTPPSTEGVVDKKEPESEKKQGYTGMAIVQPKMNETLRSNNGDVQVAIELKPGLATGDTITIYLDGKAVIKGSGQTSATLTNLDRGSHTLRATVFNKDGIAVISSRSIIFHLQRKAVTPEVSDKDNSEAFKPDFDQDETKGTDYEKDFDQDYKKDFVKDYDGSSTYTDKAKDFNNGVPASSGTFSPGSSFTPNFKQK